MVVFLTSQLMTCEILLFMSSFRMELGTRVTTSNLDYDGLLEVLLGY